jgi:hypothetical protein
MQHPIQLNAFELRDIMYHWGIPRIALVGYGRGGKDTAGGWLGLFTPLRYVGSTSRVVCPLIAKDLGLSVEEAWSQRHNHRRFWHHWCNEYRKDDPTKIARQCLENGDLVVGLRDIIELNACKEEKLFDLIVWVHNNRVEKDPTVTFTSDDCDVIVENNGTYVQFYEKLTRLCRFGGIMVYEAAREFDGPTLTDNGDWIGPRKRGTSTSS